MPKEKLNNRVSLKVIRDNENTICPFGFPIPTGCLHAGELVKSLSPATSQEIAEENLKSLNAFEEKGKCFFAENILKNNKTICSFPEGQEKIEMPTGSPLYYKPMSGTLMTGLMTFPLGYYNDNSIDKSYYYGYYSMESISKDKNQKINKYAIKEEYNKSVNKLLKINKVLSSLSKKTS